MTKNELTSWLLKLECEVQKTNHCYPKNLTAGRPIPFFGNILCARVLTIGVNPSQREFNADRGWDAVTNATQWQDRLENYFHIPGAPSWHWFEPWSICLDLLGVSYASGKAAHVDVSPRPTLPMLAVKTERDEFRTMVENDVKWVLDLLNSLPQIQLLLVAGPMPKAGRGIEQLMDFIREQSPKHGTELLTGRGLPRLKNSLHPAGIPMFACPYDPKVDGLYAMVRDIYRNRDMLRTVIDHGTEELA